MAFVTLTTDQRILIKQNSRFQLLVKAAVYALADTWKNTEGAGIATAAPARRWAKSRYLAVGIMQNPTNGVDWFTVFEQAMIKLNNAAFPVWDNSVIYNETTVIDYMVANNHFNVLADMIFDLMVEKVAF